MIARTRGLSFILSVLLFYQYTRSINTVILSNGLIWPLLSTLTTDTHEPGLPVTLSTPYNQHSQIPSK